MTRLCYPSFVICEHVRIPNRICGHIFSFGYAQNISTILHSYAIRMTVKRHCIDSYTFKQQTKPSSSQLKFWKIRLTDIMNTVWRSIYARIISDDTNVCRVANSIIHIFRAKLMHFSVSQIRDFVSASHVHTIISVYAWSICVYV